FAIADPDDEIFFSESERTHDINTKCDQFDIRCEIRFTDDIAIQLKVLAETAALLFFVAEELAYGKPFERFLKLAFMRGDHARERRRQLGAQRDFAFAFVGEIKKLIDN